MVASRTLHLAWTGDIFFAPCLKHLREQEQTGGCDKEA